LAAAREAAMWDEVDKVAIRRAWDDPAYAQQYREKAAPFEKDAAARRRDAQRVEKAHDELVKRRDRLEKQTRQV
jgi:hypothetical protein